MTILSEAECERIRLAVEHNAQRYWRPEMLAETLFSSLDTISALRTIAALRGHLRWAMDKMAERGMNQEYFSEPDRTAYAAAMEALK